MLDAPEVADEFVDRIDVGRRLARRLERYRRTDAVILALPRGGVQVGFVVAERLGLPLDVLIVRKVGHPSNPEYGLGSVVEGLPPVMDRIRIAAAGLTEEDLAPAIERARQEVERLLRRYRAGRQLVELRGRIVILVDDGIATGGTMRSALEALRQSRPAKIVLAVGVSPPETFEELRHQVDELVCLSVPVPFSAVGQVYRRFDQVSDDEVVDLLRRSRSRLTREIAAPAEPEPLRRGLSQASRTSGGRFRRTPVSEAHVSIPLDANQQLSADLATSTTAGGVVVFAHGSGSGRASPRSREVARQLHQAGFGTLLIDLLTESEAAVDSRTQRYRFDVPLLGERLLVATDWLRVRPDTGALPIGYYGASTGGAAALLAAAARPTLVSALVLRGARTDLAGAAVQRVSAATLLIVGGDDLGIREMNERTLAELPGIRGLAIVPGASHLFSEPGALQKVARLTVAWFRRHLGRST